MALASLAMLLVVYVVVHHVLGSDPLNEGMVAMNEHADLILTSGKNGSILANGIDIIQRFVTLEARVKAQAATIDTFKSNINSQATHNETIVALNQVIATLNSSVTTLRNITTAQTSIIADLTARLVNIEKTPSACAIMTVPSDLDCKRTVSFYLPGGNTSSGNITAGKIAANLVNGQLNGFCNEIWVQSDPLAGPGMRQTRT